MFEKLLEDVKKLNLPKGNFVLFGSAPIIVRGIREASHDIDIVVRQQVWNEYQEREEFVTKYAPDTDPYLEWEGHDIELWKSWGPGDWDIDKIIDDAEEIDGLPYVKLETVLEWKQRNTREKDGRDAKLIEDFLKKQGK